MLNQVVILHTWQDSAVALTWKAQTVLKQNSSNTDQPRQSSQLLRHLECSSMIPGFLNSYFHMAMSLCAAVGQCRQTGAKACCWCMHPTMARNEDKDVKNTHDMIVQSWFSSAGQCLRDVTVS
jgi:hypothetical protein